MNKVKALPGIFPLHEDREFLRESEWVILKLLCRPVDSLAEAKADELSLASGGQITPERCDTIIRIVRISRLPGLGTWFARLAAEAGFDDADLANLPAGKIADSINQRASYPIIGEASVRALEALQLQWKGAGLPGQGKRS